MNPSAINLRPIPIIRSGWLEQCGENAVNPPVANLRTHAFYEAGLAAGGTDNGKPGPRRDDGYYGAFLLDPDGNNIEACVRGEAAL